MSTYSHVRARDRLLLLYDTKEGAIFWWTVGPRRGRNWWRTTYCLHMRPWWRGLDAAEFL